MITAKTLVAAAIVSAFFWAVPVKAGQIETGQNINPDRLSESRIKTILNAVSSRQLHPLTESECFRESKEASLSSKPPQGVEWSYAWGVTLGALLRASEITGDKVYSDFVNRHNEIVFKYYDFLDWQDRTFGEKSKSSIPALTYFMSNGSMGSQVLEYLVHFNGKSTPQLESKLQIIAKSISAQYRLADGTICRPAHEFNDNFDEATIWADDLYMICPFLTQWGQFKGDDRYKNDAIRQIINYSNRLLDKDGLYYHGWFVDQKKTSPYKWGRGNGWALLSEIEVLSHMPEDHKDKAKLLAILRKHIDGLISVQSQNGMWLQILDDPNSWEETSCTAMFVYGIAAACNNGWIDRSKVSSAEKGFAALAKYISPEGSVGGICIGTGLRTDRKWYIDRPRAVDDSHGTGPVILAVVELLRTHNAHYTKSIISDEIAPLNAPFAMPQLKRPTFPANVFNIIDFGAIGDGKIKNTEAFAKAIKTCSDAGGGIVLVPPGTWLTGAIHLKSNINLHLVEDATILFSTDPNDYLPAVFVRWAGQECMNYSPLIYVNNAENIAITGSGVIDGQGEPWWYIKPIEDARSGKELYKLVLDGVPPEKRLCATVPPKMRPQLIQPINCRNVLIEGITIKSCPFWTIQAVYCENVIVRKIKVFNSVPNNDGVNCDSSRNMLIEHCYFATADDAIAIKSGINEDGWRVGRPSENIVIRHCYNDASKHGGVAFGSDTSGGIRNVFIKDFHFCGTVQGFQFKSNEGRGGFVENIWIEDVVMSDILRNAIQINMMYTAWMPSNGGKPPIYRNMHFKNIHCGKADRPLLITCLPNSHLENCTFEHLTAFSNKGIYCSDVNNITFDHVTVMPQTGPAIQLKNARNTLLTHMAVPTATDIFLELNGENTSGIYLKNNIISKTQKLLLCDETVPNNAVTSIDN